MNQKHKLLVDFCSYEAAKYAIERWHYSRVMPAGKLIKLGIWENDTFVGCVLFGRGANNHIGSPYGLSQIEICELVRIALNTHKCQVSQIVAISLKILKRQSPGLRLVVSYADPEQNHKGIIYQASNWVYCGSSQPQRFALGLHGEIVHKKTMHSKRGTIVGLQKSKILWKHKYLYPLDRAMRRQIEPLAKPYPKRADN
jgi:hypothetical protein